MKYGIVDCSLGLLSVAAVKKGICAVYFGENECILHRELCKEFPKVDLIRNENSVKKWTEMLVNYLRGEVSFLSVPYVSFGTSFQRSVWDFLRTIDVGQTLSYSAVASALGRPSSVRAIANACACNSTSLIVPCHRVVLKSGAVGGYRWGLWRKKALLALERHMLPTLNIH